MSLKLFDYDNRNKYVHQVFDNKERISPKTQYRLAGSPNFGETELGDPRFHYSPVSSESAIGMYDVDGYYCTYCPPIQTPGINVPVGRFVRHPWSEEERRRQEAFA
ncbi:MAG: hypothetical protein ACO3FP_08315 [Burkholderiales bacterium]